MLHYPDIQSTLGTTNYAEDRLDRIKGFEERLDQAHQLLKQNPNDAYGHELAGKTLRDTQIFELLLQTLFDTISASE